MPYKYQDKEAQRLIEQMYRDGFTQAGVDEVYRRLGLGPAPTVPAEFAGQALMPTRVGRRYRDGSPITGNARDFLNTFGQQAVDPFRTYGVGNYLGLAGMLVGAAGAAGAFSGAASAGASGGAASGSAGATGSGGLGVFANGGTAGLAGVGGGNAGALAASGGITGGAGTGGTAAGAFGSGGLGRALNSLSGLSAGGNMGWDWGQIFDYGAPLLGGLLEADGAKDAARASARATQAGIDEQRRQYDTTRADLMPWLDAGRGALGRLQNPVANFAESPDYQFRRDEGMRDIGNYFGAKGGAASGNALRALAEFNNNLAGSEFGNWWNRQAGLAGVGQTASQNIGSFGANSASNIGNLLGLQGVARASGIEGQTNALTGMLQNLLSTWKHRNQPG